MRLGETYWGFGPNNSWFIEIIAVIATVGLISFQAGCWVALGLTSWRIFNIGKELV